MHWFVAGVMTATESEQARAKERRNLDDICVCVCLLNHDMPMLCYDKLSCGMWLQFNIYIVFCVFAGYFSGPKCWCVVCTAPRVHKLNQSNFYNVNAVCSAACEM